MFRWENQKGPNQKQIDWKNPAIATTGNFNFSNR